MLHRRLARRNFALSVGRSSRGPSFAYWRLAEFRSFSRLAHGSWVYCCLSPGSSPVLVRVLSWLRFLAFSYASLAGFIAWLGTLWSGIAYRSRHPFLSKVVAVALWQSSARSFPRRYLPVDLLQSVCCTVRIIRDIMSQLQIIKFDDKLEIFVVYSLAESRNLTDPVKFQLSPRHSSLTTKINLLTES